MKFIFLAMNLFVAIALPTVGLQGVFVFLFVPKSIILFALA